MTVAQQVAEWAVGRHLLGAVPAAAFATGALVHALDFDDTHGGELVHVSAIVLPTARRRPAGPRELGWSWARAHGRVNTLEDSLSARSTAARGHMSVV